MRLSLRFIVPLARALAAITYGVVPYVDQLTLPWFVRDLDILSQLIANAVQEPLAEMLQSESPDRPLLPRAQTFFDRVLKYDTPSCRTSIPATTTAAEQEQASPGEDQHDEDVERRRHPGVRPRGAFEGSCGG